jgi:hypothetical protein
MDLAALAPADDASGDSHTGPLAFWKVGVHPDNVRNGHCAVKSLAPWVNSERFDRMELFKTDFGKVLGFVGHGAASGRVIKEDAGVLALRRAQGHPNRP